MGAYKSVQRNYNMPDAEMIQASRVYLQLFISDKEQFTTFDADFADPFAEQWLAKIDEATEVDKDLLLKDSLAEKTRVVQQAFTNCRAHYIRMKYFIEKAFAESRETRLEFGYEDYSKINKSEEKMLRFMDLLSLAAAKYQPELLAAGCPPGDILQTRELYNMLQDAFNARQVFSKERMQLTAARLKILNDCWNYTLKVNRASKIVFAGKPAMMASYVFTPLRKKKDMPVASQV